MTILRNKSTEENIQASDRIWNPAFTSVFIANSCMYLAQQMTNSLIAKYSDHLGATPTLVGLVTSMFAVTALLFKIFSGPTIDAFNRRFILMGAMTIMAIAFVGYGISANIPTLIGFRLLQGAGQAFTATCSLALAADTLPKNKLGAGIGVFSMAQAASQAIGPTIALHMVKIFDYNNTFIIGSFVMLFAAFMAFRVKIDYKKTNAFKISFKSIVAKEAVMPTIIIFFLAMTFCVINSFLIIYAGKQGIENIGYYFTVYAGTLLFTRPFVGKLTDKYGLVKVIIPAMICFAGSFIIISFSNSLPVFLLAAFVSAFGFGACQPAIQTLSMKSVPVDKRGAGSSTNYIGNDLGNLTGPILAGFIVERLGYASMWRIMIFPIAIALIMVLIYSKRINHIEETFKKKMETSV